MIPNVSSIYRDLACMADPKPVQPLPSSSYSQTSNPFYSDKQQRHNQLM